MKSLSAQVLCVLCVCVCGGAQQRRAVKLINITVFNHLAQVPINPSLLKCRRCAFS